MKKYFFKLVVKFAMLFRPLISLASLFLSLLRNIVSILENVLELLPVLVKKVKKSAGSSCQVDIHVKEYSPLLIRDLLMLLNTLYERVAASKGIISVLRIQMGNLQLSCVGEIFSCLTMNSLVRDIQFDWIQNSKNIFNAPASYDNEKTEYNSGMIDIFIDNIETSILRVDEYFSLCESNFLEVPPSTKVWARSVLKTYRPGLFIVCVHISNMNVKAARDPMEGWRDFFFNICKDFPDIYFLILDHSPCESEESYISNVIYTKLLGYNFLEEFALVQVADMYLGSYDRYSMAIIGTEKPYILFGINNYDRDYINEKTDVEKRMVCRNDYQRWYLEDILPMDFYHDFKMFYVNLQRSGEHKREKFALNNAV
ncbi:MAG: hypothetical protein KA807_00930 [Prolixibacteraceae bacterium]|nr:hypothetical protein [Prolixibacteraceae bacterium]